MVSDKNILRSLIVLISVLAAGFLGLWFLSGPKIIFKNQNASVVKVKIPENGRKEDEFSDFGGKTPRETLDLFIAALENNDLTTAAKYFVFENRETASEDLARLGNDNFLGDLISDLKSVKTDKAKNEADFYFEVADRNDQTITALELVKNQKGVWKIVSL